MSLNGLDTPAVQEAYQQAVTEAGGWFLLRYTSRDSVELLGRGRGGVHEARICIAKYDEQSPLYGLIVYRRRKFLIKYIPEGTSRLLQARTAVHFQDILERYSPYETLLEITSADSLNDTSLASSFPLHTASPSASSNRLHEISEDAEDASHTPRRPANHSFSSTGSIFGTQRYKMEKRVDQVMGPDRPPLRKNPSIQVTDSTSTSSSPYSSPQKTSISQILVHEDSGQRSVSSLASMTDYTTSEDSNRAIETASQHVEQPAARTPPALQESAEVPRGSLEMGREETPTGSRSDAAERQSSLLSDRSVERPTTQQASNTSEKPKVEDEPYDFSKFEPKRKVKLGPRPVEFGKEAKRPTVAGLAAVPAAYRPAQKKQESSRPKSQEPLIENERRKPEFPKPPPIPNVPEYIPRPVSRGSIKSLPSQKSTNMTPEKARLMKALELRKKQMRKSNPQQYTINAPKDEVTPAMPKVPEPSDREAAKSSGKGVGPAVSIHSQHPAISNKADSGIEIDYEKQQERRDGLTQGKGPQEEPIELPANHSTLHQLEASSPPQLDRISSRSETSSRRPDTNAEAGAEPTVFSHMLDDAPQPSFPWIDQRSSDEQDSGADQPSPNGERVMSATSTTSSFQAKSPAVSQPATYRPSGADRADQERRAEERLANSEEARLSSESYRQESGNLAKRRRGIVEPLDIDPQLNQDSSSDEELSRELQDPVSVSHSPIAEDSERRRSTQSAVSENSNASTRSVNVPRSTSNLPRQSKSPRASRNHALVTQSSRTDEFVDSLTRNPSTSQSKGSHQPSELGGAERGSTASISPEAGPTNTWRDRKTAVRSPPRSRPGSFRRQSARGTPGVQSSSQAPTWNVQHDPSLNRDSISVSARIVRPPPRGDMGNSSIDGQLHHSQLTVNHKRASVSNQSRRLSPLQTSNLPKSESAPSTMAHPPAPENRHFQLARPSVIGRWQGNQGTSSPLTPSADDFPPPPTQRNSHASSMNVGDDSATPKEGSRTSRFFKRMSNFGTGHKRRTSGQNVVSAMSALDVSSNQRSSTAAATDKSDTPPPVVVGDLNVQFPDSLLWKRRIVEIDDGGHIVFAISQAMDVQRAAVKRFHLSEFKQPYAPDLERQELPHSVMLEFSDGTALQTACEDAMTARQVLHVLRNYWRAWNGVGA